MDLRLTCEAPQQMPHLCRVAVMKVQSTQRRVAQLPHPAAREAQARKVGGVHPLLALAWPWQQPVDNQHEDFRGQAGDARAGTLHIGRCTS